MTDVTQLIEHLRGIAEKQSASGDRTIFPATLEEAADALESLSAENADLREALKPFSEIAEELGDGIADNEKNTLAWAVPYAGDLRNARAKLEGRDA